MAPPSYTPPGRLGDPNMSLETDPRTNPNVLKALQSLGMGANQVSDLPDSSEWTIESLTPGLAASDAAFGGMYDFLPNDLPTDAEQPAIDISEQTIKGVDDNDIKLYIYKPVDAKGPLPAVIYTHGGGMVSLPCGNNVKSSLPTIRITY
jgi:acetyl esterase